MKRHTRVSKQHVAELCLEASAVAHCSAASLSPRAKRIVAAVCICVCLCDLRERVVGEYESHVSDDERQEVLELGQLLSLDHVAQDLADQRILSHHDDGLAAEGNAHLLHLHKAERNTQAQARREGQQRVERARSLQRGMRIA